MPEPEKYKETRARYRETHREERNALSKAIYERDKEAKIEKVKQWRTQNIERLTDKIECGCGGKFQYRTKAEHERSLRHKKYIETAN